VVKDAWEKQREDTEADYQAALAAWNGASAVAEQTVAEHTGSEHTGTESSASGN
jgi:hypothetical protein